jgi:hypothetical protein
MLLILPRGATRTMRSGSAASTVLIVLLGYTLFHSQSAASEPDAAKGGLTKGCLIITTFKLPDKGTYAAEHCVSGYERCNAQPNGYCFDFGIIDPTVVSKSCTPVERCPEKPELK